MEESAPSEMKEETTDSLRALDVGEVAILGTFYPADRKSRMMVINLDRLVHHEGTAQDSGLKKGAAGVITE
jgi:hypothetical protein